MPHSFSSATGWAALANVIRIGVQLIQLIVMTRFLSPDDYGLMALVVVTIGFVNLFGDMGLSTAFIQRQDITQEERSSLYWLGVVIGCCCMVGVVGLSPILADFYGRSELMPLLTLISVNFVVIALGQQLRTDAEKRLDFKPLALIDITAALAGLFVAVWGALNGLGVYALIAASISTVTLSTALCWLVLSNGWRPLLRLRWGDVRRFLSFGGAMVFNNVINYINTNMDVFLSGRFLGASQLGLYSVPRNLILQVQFAINPIFTRVGFPAIASAQQDRDCVQKIYLKIMNATASINAPIYTAIFIFSPEFVRVFLGVEFHDAASLMQVLALWGLLRSFGNPIGSLLFGLGKVRLSVFWNLGLLFFLPIVLWIGLQYGVMGMAWSMVVMMALLFLPGWAILVRPNCGVGLRLYTEQIFRPCFCALISGFIAWLVVFPASTDLLRLVLGLMAGFLIYVFLSYKLNKTFIELIFKKN